MGKRGISVEPETKQNWLRAGLAAVNQAMFGYGSPVSMGVFRIFTGTLAFINFAMIAVDFDAWFGERGYVPSRIGDRAVGDLVRINFLYGVADDRITIAFYVLTMIAAVLTAFGLWSRVSSVVLAVGVITLHHRNILILHGGDTLLRMCCIYVALSPSGAACSVDRLVRLWKGKEVGAPALVSLWPQRLVEYNIALLYFTSVWNKSFGSAWKGGYATYYPLNLHEFDRFWVPDFLQRQPFLMLTTYGTLAVELAMATLVFYKPARRWVILSALGLHAFIEYSMNIPLFEWVMVSTFIAFYEGEEITAWAKRMGQRLKRCAVTVFLPQGTGLHPERGAALKATDAFGLVTYDTGREPTWSAQTANGKPRAPLWASWSRSLGAWPLTIVPGTWRRILFGAIEENPVQNNGKAVTDGSPKLHAKSKR